MNWRSIVVIITSINSNEDRKVFLRKVFRSLGLPVDELSSNYLRNKSFTYPFYKLATPTSSITHHRKGWIVGNDILKACSGNYAGD